MTDAKTNNDHLYNETSACVDIDARNDTNLIMDRTAKKKLCSKKRQILAIICTIFLRVLSHFWHICTACVLILVLTWWMYGGLLFFSLFCLSVMGLVYHGQDLMLYYPDEPTTARLYVDLPTIVNLPYEEHYVKTQDGVTLNMVFIKRSSENCPTVLYFHGNAGNIGNRLLNVHGLYTSCQCNVLLVEYRGYGKSEGSPSESGLYKDAAAGMEFLLRQDIDLTRIVVFGRSLGGAVATHLVSTPHYARHIAALIVENTFTSIPDIASVLFRAPFVKQMPMFLIKNKYPSLLRVSQIRQPTLFLSGLSDELVPSRMMRTLYQHSRADIKRLHTYENGSHSDTWTCNNYYSHISAFLSQVQQHSSSSAGKNAATCQHSAAIKTV